MMTTPRLWKPLVVAGTALVVWYGPFRSSDEVAAQVRQSAPATAGAYQHVTFWELSEYFYNPQAHPGDPTPPKPSRLTIPVKVLALSGKKVALMGTMIPLNGDQNGATEFILAVSQDSCGFGVGPRINEWVHVKMRDGVKVKYREVDALVKGTFRVHEVVEGGRVVGLYHMVGDEVQ
jgi:hypothetical protein